MHSSVSRSPFAFFKRPSYALSASEMAISMKSDDSFQFGHGPLRHRDIVPSCKQNCLVQSNLIACLMVRPILLKQVLKPSIRHCLTPKNAAQSTIIWRRFSIMSPRL